MRKIIYLAWLLLVSAMALQAQTKGETWKDLLERTKENAPKANLELLGYTYLGAVETQEQFDSLKVKLLAGDNYFPTDGHTVIRLDEFKDVESLNRYRKRISEYLDALRQFDFGVVELNWKQGDKKFNSYCLVKERAIVFDHIILNVLIDGGERKSVTRTTRQVDEAGMLQIMMSFLGHTLERNYGKNDWKAAEFLMNDMRRGVVVKVQKESLKTINQWLREFPFLSELCRTNEFVGGESAVVHRVIKINTDLEGWIEHHPKEGALLTLYFWPYLCHCADIDIRTGQDKTDVILEQDN